MAIVIEKVTVRDIEFTHTYSDAGMKIKRDGAIYDEAYDPTNTNRIYTETSEPIENPEAMTEEQQYAEAGRILMGVIV